MNIRKALTYFSAAAVLMCFAGCRSAETAQTSEAATAEAGIPATVTEPAAETVSAANTGVPAAKITTSYPYETTMIDGIEVAIMTTSSQADTTTAINPAETAVTTAKSLAETTFASTETPVTTPLFTDAEEDDIKLEIISGAKHITTDTDSITVRISYVGEDEKFFYTGVNYELEQEIGGMWAYRSFFEPMSWIEVAFEVSKHSSPTIEVSLDDALYEHPINAGKYRVVKHIGGREYYAEFEVESGETDPEYEIAEKNGEITLRIDSILDDKFVCEMPFPLPARYYVLCDTAYYDDLCVGDTVLVKFSKMLRVSNDNYRIYPTEISYTEFELDPNVAYKPVIYLYPEEQTDVSIKLDHNGRLTFTDPEYRDGWTVTAHPDGTLVCDGKEYPYLFWEGEMDYALDTSRGFCVSGEDTERFLAEKLAYLGLNESEAAEFMDFWLPFMENNAYNVITFAGEDYTDNAMLDISPSPETMIRVFMSFTPSERYVDIPVQALEKAPERNGFTVVEWGGSIKNINR